MPEVVTKIDTDVHFLCNIACINEEFWITALSSEMKRFNTDGTKQETVSTYYGGSPNGIAVTRQGELVYTDGNYKCVIIVRKKQKKWSYETLITLQDWIPNSICATDSDDLLISMYSSSEPSRVVRYVGSTEKQIFQYQEGRSLFSNGHLRHDQNRNGDVCVSDYDANQVVVVNHAGELRFRYTEISRPFGIITDSRGNILVTGWQFVHVIDQDAGLLCLIDQSKLPGLPNVLGLDKYDRLFVCTNSGGTINVIKYLE